MLIRQAVLQDIDEILKLTNLVADKHGQFRADILFEHPYHITKEKLDRNILANNHFVLVADENETIVGVVLCTIRSILNDVKFKDTNIMSIEDTCVDSNFRAMNVGSMLIDAAKRVAREHDCSRLETNVWSFNDESILFFQANGFSAQRIIMECFLDEQ